MVNNVIISGYYKGFEFNNLLLKVEGIKDNQILKIHINKSLKKELQENLKMDTAIAISGYIELDELYTIIIKATKIAFLAN